MLPPTSPRVIAFFDAQNLYHAAKREFGYTHPNFDPLSLATLVAGNQGWALKQVRLYTGIPDVHRSPHWNGFWNSRLGQLHDAGIFTYSRALVYAGGIPREKGIDVRISLDIIRLAMKREYDVALLFSQDQDLSEVAKEIREVAREQQRWIKIASALPMARDSKANQGVNFTDWLPIDRQTYDPCIDPRDYRPRSAGGRPTD